MGKVTFRETREADAALLFGAEITRARIGVSEERFNRDEVGPAAWNRSRRGRTTVPLNGIASFTRRPRRDQRFPGRRDRASPLRSNLAVQEGALRGNTLDRLESCLSARLPRIMDATVTHVNEAHHLHLLHLPRLATVLAQARRAVHSCGSVASVELGRHSWDNGRSASDAVFFSSRKLGAEHRAAVFPPRCRDSIARGCSSHETEHAARAD